MPEQEVEHIQMHDIKTIFYLVIVDEDDAAVDLTLATVLDVYFEKPKSGTKVVRTGTVHDAVAGIYKYQLDIEDATEDGLFEIQGYVVTPDWEGSSEKGFFYVERNIISRTWSHKPAYLVGL